MTSSLGFQHASSHTCRRGQRWPLRSLPPICVLPLLRFENMVRTSGEWGDNLNPYQSHVGSRLFNRMLINPPPLLLKTVISGLSRWPKHKMWSFLLSRDLQVYPAFQARQDFLWVAFIVEGRNGSRFLTSDFHVMELSLFCLLSGTTRSRRATRTTRDPRMQRNKGGTGSSGQALGPPWTSIGNLLGLPVENLFQHLWPMRHFLTQGEAAYSVYFWGGWKQHSWHWLHLHLMRNQNVVCSAGQLPFNKLWFVDQGTKRNLESWFVFGLWTLAWFNHSL